MSEKVDEVAKAIAKKLDMEDVDFTQTARTAIATMREPTKEMIKAAWDFLNDNSKLSATPAGIWQAMIDEALK